MRLSQRWFSRDWRGCMSGPLCYLDSSPVLISRAWAWRETTAGPQPKQTDSWSARHATQRHGGWEDDPHACMAHFVAFVCASMNKCRFTPKDEKFQLNLNWLWIQLLSALVLFICFTEVLYGAKNLHVQQNLSELVVGGFIAGFFLTSHHAELYGACAATKERHNCLSHYLLNWMRASSTAGIKWLIYCI